MRFAGRLDDAEKNIELQKAHLLLHTSMREGWGLNVIEANAMGTPAVVYPVGGLVDSTVHGQTGLGQRSRDAGEPGQGRHRLGQRPKKIRRNAHGGVGAVVRFSLGERAASDLRLAGKHGARRYGSLCSVPAGRLYHYVSWRLFLKSNP